MADKRKKLNITYVNKVKYENHKDFGNSIFSYVYYSAKRMVKRIIKENEGLEDSVPDKEYSTDEQFNNVIAFLGERGMGKSSAMLSFALSLKEQPGEYGSDIAFTVQPRMDVAMMVKGENIMDIVLARLWDVFERKSEIIHRSEIYFEEVKDDFKRVKKSYEMYKQTLMGKEIIHNMPSIREMRELSVCLNLRENFKKLVEDYLKYEMDEEVCHKKNRYLVLSIDDLDMASGDIYRILEQIRLFLIIPKVIVLVTADINKLFMACNRNFSEQLMYKEQHDSYEIRQMRGYVTDYLAKLFPSNMRIQMPELGTVHGIDYEIELTPDIRKVLNIKGKSAESLDEKKLLFLLLIKYSNIIFLTPSQGKHFLQKRSLRRIVNNLYNLINISEEPHEEWFHSISGWYYTELEEYGKEMENTELGRRLQKLLNSSSESLPLSIANVLQSMKKDDSLGSVGTDYGEILLALYLIMDKEEVYNFISLVYSIYIQSLQEQRNSLFNSEKRTWCKIFNPMLSRREYVGSSRFRRSLVSLESRRLIYNLFDIKMEYRKKDNFDILEILKDNQEAIVQIFRLASLCTCNLWDAKNEDYCEWEIYEGGIAGETIEITLSPKNNKKRQETSFLLASIDSKKRIIISLDMVFHSAIYYEEYVKGFCQNLYKSISKYFEIKEEEEKISKIVSKMLAFPVWKLAEYRKWKQTYHICSVTDLLPLQSVDLMRWIAETLPSWRDVPPLKLSVPGITVSLLDWQLEDIVKKLQMVEERYGYARLRGKGYSERLLEYFDIIQVTQLSKENQERLDKRYDEFTVQPAV